MNTKLLKWNAWDLNGWAILQSICLGILLTGCVSMSADDQKAPPPITDNMPIEQVLNVGIEFGGASFDETKSWIKRHKKFSDANRIVQEMIFADKFQKEQMWRLVHLYQATSTNLISPKLLNFLISHSDSLTRQLGWMLASQRPSDIVATVIERHLTESVINSTEDQVLFPEMALAIKENGLKSAYSLLVTGLMTKGGVEYVEAMASLDPLKAKDDFLIYLSLATVEDLRQMNQKTIDIHSGVAILKFLLTEGAPIEHPKFEHLFLFAVSRNAAFSELATDLIRKYMETSRDHLAYTLARQPVWIQVAFIESTKDRMSPNIGLFLSELKQVTSHREVVEEIEAIRR